MIGSWKFHSWQQVLVALVLGAVVGAQLGVDAKPLGYLGTIFLNLIRMVTVPMIFFTIIYGITGIKTSQGLYRVSIKAVIIFLLTSTLAVSLGLLIPNIMKPGVGVPPTILDNFKDSTQLPKVHNESLIDVIINLIPSNVFGAMAEANILQIIVFAFFVGTVLNIKRRECYDVVKVAQQIAVLFFNIIRAIMKIAPVGVFGYIAALVGSEGLGILENLGRLVLVVLVGCVVQYLVFGVLIVIFARISPIPFYKKILGPQLIAFSTSSSKATLVPLMDVAETQMGISKEKSRFLLPLSAALNMDGGAIYQATCAVFFAQMLGVEFSAGQYLTLLFMCTLASIGGAGIPGGVLLFLGMVLHSVGLPVAGVLLVASVDRVLDMMTTLVNITGCACVTILVDCSDGTCNLKAYYNMRNITNNK